MTTTEAICAGAAVGFLLASVLWVLLGLAIGLLQNGIEEALRERLNLDTKGEKEDATKTK